MSDRIVNLEVKKYTNYIITDENAGGFSADNIVLSPKRDYKKPEYGGWRNVWYQLDKNRAINTDNVARFSLTLNNVEMLYNEKEFDGETGSKTYMSCIIKLDLSNPEHRRAAKAIVDMYDSIFGIIADRSSRPHETLKLPSGVTKKTITALCTKENFTERDQEKLDSEIERLFPIDKLLNGVERDDNGEILLTCRPALFAKINPYEPDKKFYTTIIDTERETWSIKQLKSKVIRGTIQLSIGSLSITDKGVKINIDTKFIVVHDFEEVGKDDPIIQYIIETVPDEKKRALSLKKKKYKEQNERLETNNDDEGIPDDDEFQEDILMED